MNWEREGRSLLEAVAYAIEANDGEDVNAEMVNAQLAEPLEERRLDRKLGELCRDEFIEGPKIENCAAPTSISLAPRGARRSRAGPAATEGFSRSQARASATSPCATSTSAVST